MYGDKTPNEGDQSCVRVYETLRVPEIATLFAVPYLDPLRVVAPGILILMTSNGKVIRARSIDYVFPPLLRLFAKDSTPFTELNLASGMRLRLSCRSSSFHAKYYRTVG